MLPLLQFFGDTKEHPTQETADFLGTHFSLTESEKKEKLPSGTQTVFLNRLYWARIYLNEAALIERPKKGTYKITQEGMNVLAKRPEKITIQFLKQFPSFLEFKARHHEKPGAETGGDSSVDSKTTPLESFEAAYQSIKENLAAELLQTVKESSPSFFERLVVDLLVKMGYGGTLKDAGQAIGKSGDGGIDGIIKEDRLGLDTIYIQAKKWDSVVGRPEIQKFAGALQGNRAKKGIFLTTANYSKDAVDFASRIDSKIILIDGETLVDFMIDHSVGVSAVANYEIKKIDSDYFVEE